LGVGDASRDVSTGAAAREVEPCRPSRAGPLLSGVVLLAVRLAEGERAGIDGVPALRETAPAARILVTTVSADVKTVLEAVRAGADG
jgi:DNA-binding NarL/FixJ family response regulator